MLSKQGFDIGWYIGNRGWRRERLEGWRRFNSALFALGVIITLCSSLCLFPSHPPIGETGGKWVQQDSLASYTAHSPFNITHLSNFTSLGISGSGTHSEPFVIENFHIISTVVGIFISNIDRYFVIRNCLIESDVEHALGIQLINCSNSVIEDSAFNQLQIGISLFLVNQSIIRNNTVDEIQDYGWGIGGSNLTHMVFDKNKIRSTGYNTEGIPVEYGWNGINAKSFSSHVTWDDGASIGNYWGDWDGEGSYEISLQGEDRYPQILVTLFSFDTPFMLSEESIILMLTFGGLGAFILVVVVLSRRFLTE
ncbi:MAG: right-handed parallel beta-helix repeat-containing protein [Candidatus Thorarchaeota archaeon]|nr:right-handed parallel beta-helix repeat-containing protein [Candidatus Thorarchaeota archaeon]